MPEPAEALPETTPIERQRKMLERLGEAGLEIALAIEKRVKEAGPDEPLAALNAAGHAYAQVARSVRLCVLLQEELAKGRPDPESAARQAEAGRRKAHIDRAVGIVRRVARDHCRIEPYMVSLMAKEASERLDTDDIYGQVLTRPVGELVALICRDLGLEPHWPALAEEAWAQAEMDSRPQGSPFLDDELWEDVPEDGPEPASGLSRPVRPAETLEDAALALAPDPEIVAAARCDTG